MRRIMTVDAPLAAYEIEAPTPRPIMERAIPSTQSDGLACAYCGTTHRRLKVYCTELHGVASWDNDYFCSAQCWRKFNE